MSSVSLSEEVGLAVGHSGMESAGDSPSRNRNRSASCQVGRTVHGTTSSLYSQPSVRQPVSDLRQRSAVGVVNTRQAGGTWYGVETDLTAPWGLKHVRDATTRERCSGGPCPVQVESLVGDFSPGKAKQDPPAVEWLPVDPYTTAGGSRPCSPWYVFIAFTIRRDCGASPVLQLCTRVSIAAAQSRAASARSVLRPAARARQSGLEKGERPGGKRQVLSSGALTRHGSV